MNLASMVLRRFGIVAIRVVTAPDRVIVPPDYAVQYVGPIDPWEGEAVNDEGPEGMA